MSVAIRAALVGFALVGAAPAAAAPFVYVVSNTGNVSRFDAPLDSFEALNPLTPATVAAGFSPRAGAVSPDGKSVCVANTSGKTLSQFSIDVSTGALSPSSGIPRDPQRLAGFASSSVRAGWPPRLFFLHRTGTTTFSGV